MWHPHKPDYQYHVSAHLAGIPPLGYRIVVPEDNNGGTTYKSYVVVEGWMRTHELAVTLYCRAA